MIKKNIKEIIPDPPKKLRQEIVVKMNNNDIFHGRIFIGLNETLLGILNDDRQFIALELDNYRTIFIAKKEITAVDFFQNIPENPSKFEKKLNQSTLYRPPRTQYVLRADDINSQNIAESQPLPEEKETIQEAIKPEEKPTITPKEYHDNRKHYDNIYDRYTHIVRILNSSLFKDRRKKDRDFDNSIHSILEALRITSTLLEKTRKKI